MNENSNLIKSNNAQREFDLGLFKYILKKNFIWMVLIILLSVLGIFLTLRYTQPIYMSSSTLQIEKNDRANQFLDVGEIYETNEISAEIELLKSNYLITKAIETLPLKISYYSQGKFLDKELYKGTPFKVECQIKDSSIIGETFFIEFESQFKCRINYRNSNQKNTTINLATNNWVNLDELAIKVTIEDYDAILDNNNQVKKNDYYFKINNIDVLVENYAQYLNVNILNASAKTIEVSYTDENPYKAKDFVGAIVNEFKVYDINRRKKSSSRILEFIDQQLESVYKRQRNAEIKIQNFKRDNNVINQKEFSQIYLEKLNQLDDVLIETTIQKNILQQIHNQLNVNTSKIDIYELIPLVMGSEYQGSLEQLINELNVLLIEKQNLLYSNTEKSDQIKSINYKIEVQKNLLMSSVATILSKLKSRIGDLEKKIKSVQEQFYGVPEKEIELSRLQRTFEIDDRFYTLLLEKRTEYSISEAGFVSQTAILMAPNQPQSPVSPNKKVIFIGFLLAGILANIVLLISKYLLHDKITNIEDIKKYSKSTFSVLGIIPKYKHNISANEQLVVNENPKSLIAEAFRSVRSNLEFISNQEGAKLMAVTSTISQEGKTFVAINLGGIIAFSGKKVIILDLDMRKPKIHVGFGATNTCGMSTLLIGKNSIEDCIQHSNEENLDFITAGPIPPNPSELILSNKIDEIIVELKKQYDLIIIDNPPVGLVTDGISIIQKADYPIYIVRSEYSKKSFIENIDKLIIDNKVSKLSVILNGYNATNDSYGYRYGYGGGYYEEDAERSNKGIKNLFRRN